MIRLSLLALYLLTAPALAGQDAGEHFQQQREALVKEIQAHLEQTSRHIDREAFSPKVLEALREVPRHRFVSPEHRDQAYANRPLPIGHGQTISQPFVVALMTDLLEPQAEDRVLEVGTGSGYQAAVLAEIVDAVYTIEIIEPLARSATKRLRELGYEGVTVRHGDGYYGWEAHAPYDAIVVTAAASHLPPPLIEQLKAGGRMVIPVGSRFMTQQLVLVEKDTEGKVTTRQLLPVAFVPLTGGH